MAATSSWREPAPAERLDWVRCRYCSKRFFKADAVGRIEIVCPACKRLQTHELARRG
jgi:hypothetical protein